MTSVASPRYYSYAEYEEVLAHSDIRHEYVEGVIRAMAGGTGRHNAIFGRLYAALLTPAASNGCEAYVADRRLDIGRSEGNPTRSYFPDVMVVCDPDLDAPGDRDPCFVAEVLSDSTAAVDQIEKHTAYTNVSSVLAYAIVSQHERRVVLHRRVGDVFHTEVHVAGESFTLECPPVTIAVDSLYPEG